MKIMKKRLLILLFAISTVVCLGVGLAACGDSSSESDDVVVDVPSQSTESNTGSTSSTTKQAPVYQGMVISSANSASTLSSDGAVKSYAAMGGTANPTSSAEATGALTGDVNIGGVDSDTRIHLGGDDEPTIEDEITARFGVTGTGQSIYYADPGEEILITVKFSNPDDYEILSFRINGKTYASYMFQDGSDMENIIVKLDVGTKIGFADFTIDEIKYIDGTEIKDVMLNGETSVRCGIRTDDVPYATVIEETAGIDTITLNIRIIDLYGLIEASDGYCFIALYDGDTMVVYEEYLHEGYNEIVFTGLDANTVYEYAVVAIYDNLSGDGENSINYLTENCIRTEAVVLFDGVEVTKTGVSFSYLWYEGYEYVEIHKLSLESEGDTRLTLLDSDATEITGLLSNTRYTLTASYTGPDGSVGSIHMSFTTLAMETPEITIDSVSATKTDITYSVSVTDEDTTGYVSSVAVIRDGSVVKDGLLLSGTVSGLLSNNEYTLVVTYAYDLNDGYGERTMEVTANVTTDAVAAPEFEIYTLSSTKEEISYVLYIEDADEAGYLFSVELHMGKMLAGTLFASDGVFENLYSDTEYTIKAEYVYDLNDGYGARTTTLTETVSTKAKAVPVVSIDSLTSSKTGIEYGLYVYDADGVGCISSVTLTKGTSVLTGERSETGTFDGLLSGNEYTLNVVYTYDLTDGTGEHTIELSKAVSTAAMTSPVFSVEYLKATKDGISYELYVSDTDGVGEITSVTLSKGSKTYTGSGTVGEFADLLSDNEYTFTAVYTYNLNDGEGDKTIVITQTVSTLAKVTPTISLESLSSTKTGVSYELYVSDADEVGEMTSVTLTRGSRTYTAEGYTGKFEGLFSDNEYTFAAVYTYDLNDGAGERTIVLTKTISTQAMAAPVFEISSLTSSKEDISYVLYIGDADETGYLFSVELHMGRMLVTTTPDEWGTFVGLYSDTEYTITAEYVYDLNDGEGARNIKITETISTKAKETPVVSLDTLTASRTGIDYSLAITDADGVGKVTSVVLAKGAAVISTGTAVSGSYTGLLSDNEYTLTVTYTYDLNDGTGEKTIILSETITTEATATPKLVIYTLDSTTEDISYELIETDKDEVGEIVSIELYKGEKLVASTLGELGAFEGLLSDNEYTLVVTYAYDLNDGLGTRTTEVSGTISTKAKKTPTVEIYGLTSGKEDITYGLKIGDEDGVGYISSITLSRGSLTWTVDPSEYGTFTNLLSNTEYTITAEYVYDLNDGEGARSIKVTGTISTKAKEAPVVSLDTLTASKTGIDYSLAITDADGVGKVSSVVLTKGTAVVYSDTTVSGSYTDLLSDNEYTLTVTYTYNLNDGTGEKTIILSETITTEAMATPRLVIYTLTSTSEEISYELIETDKDEVGKIVSIELYRGEKLVSSTTKELGAFEGLLSDSEYTLVVTYAYDLNDGLGTRTAEVSGTVSTKAKKTPTVEIFNLMSGKEDITYELSISDEDGVGYISSLALSRGSLTWTVDPSEYGTFTNLLSDNEYTLTVVYVYDLNDGNGQHTMSMTDSVSTLAKETPKVDIYSLTSTKNSVDYEIVVTDTDDVGEIVSVSLTKGNTVYTADTDVYGTFGELLSDNEYVLKVVYEYDLNDGFGTRTFEVSGSVCTLAVAKPEVTIDSLVSSKDGIEYVLSVTDEDEVGTTVSVMLMKGGEAVGIATNVIGGFDDLLSDNEYTLNVVYTYDLCDGLGERTLEVNGKISTLAKELPSITIDSLSSTKEEIAYGYSVVDEDDVGINVSVYLTGANGTFADETYSGRFANLWSDNEYTLTVVYAYDLGDGAGVRTLAVSGTVYTLAKESPVAEIVFIESGTYELTFSVLYADSDEVGCITDVSLYDGSVLVTATGGAYMGEMTYTGLSSYTLYTLVVSYEYNLNDGVGTRMGAVEYSYYTDPYIEFSSISVINTSAVSEGEAIVLEVDVVNPDGVEFLTVTVNGTKYDVSPVSTGTKLYIEITNEDQFAGGETTLEITRMSGTLGGKVYGLDVHGSNTASLFVNGVLLAEDFSVVHFVNGKEEEVEYAFNSDQLYYKVELGNATGYEIFSITLGGTTYSEGDFYTSDDRQTIYVSFSDGSNTGWRSKTFSSISYGNETLEFKEKIVSISTSYVRLKTDAVVEIYTADQLLEMDGWEYYKLMNDIDLSGYKKEWVNMGNNMYGVFDGNGYTISGVAAVSTYSNLDLYLGLFNNVQGIVTNLDICDVLYIVTLNNTTSSSFAVYAGGLSAKSGQVFLENCNISSSFQITNKTGGKNYIGTISGSGSSSSKLRQVVCQMSAVFKDTDNFYEYGYFGSDVSLDIVDSRCDYTVVSDSSNIDYIVEGDYRFSVEDGIYTLVDYLGKGTHIVLPESIDGNSYGLGYKVFYSSDVEEVILPEGLTYIGELAFAYSNIKSLVIPGSVKGFDTEAIYQCKNLTYVVVEEGVTSLGQLIFAHDLRLEYVVLPSTLTSIGGDAFMDCPSFMTVYYRGTETEWSKISGRSQDNLSEATIYFYSECMPESDGNYWYIVDGEIIVWTKKEN